jgi:hypothetical protein
VPAPSCDLDRRRILFGLVWTAGCASTSGEQAFETDYVVGAIYLTRQDCLIERSGTLSDHLLLRPLQPPLSAADYERDPSRWPSARGVLLAGTRLRIARLARREWPGLETVGEVYADIIDGPHAGRTVELSFISRNVQLSAPPIRAQWVDPGELQRVDPR